MKTLATVLAAARGADLCCGAGLGRHEPAAPVPGVPILGQAWMGSVD